MKDFTFTLRTLTPIWLGDVDRDCSRAKESGIIGSMRAWFAMMCRLRNVRACRPESRCSEYETRCLVCQMFGCTASSRVFRVSVDGLLNQEALYALCFPEMSETNGWWIRTSFMGRDEKALNRRVFWAPKGFQLRFRFAAKAASDSPAFLAAILTDMQKYGAIGAKTQNGFGAFDFPAETSNKIGGLLNQLPGSFPKVVASNHFFGLRCEIPENEIVSKAWEPEPPTAPIPERAPFLPVAFDLRFRTKPYASPALDRGVKHALLKVLAPELAEDVVGSEDRPSRIHLNHPYRQATRDGFCYRIKVWAELPDKVQLTTVQGAVESAIRAEFPGATFSSH